MDRLDLSSFDNAQDIKKAIADRVSSVPLKIVLNHFSEKFYDSDNVVEFLYTAVVSSSNGILYGPGGFGKTEMTKEFFNYFNVPINTVVGYQDMEVEGLLGVPDMKKLVDNSEYKTAFEKSVFGKPGILILEEFLDVRPSTAAALKDILTSNGLWQGSEFSKSLAAHVFICSNKDPEELSVDYSTAAFYKDRFPCSLFVAWDSYDSIDYESLFKLKYKKDFVENKQELKILAGLCSMSSVEDKIVSPRIALAAGEVVLKSGISAVKFINSIDTSNLSDIIYKIEQEKAVEELKSLINTIDENIKTIINSAEIVGEEYHSAKRVSLRFWINGIRELIVKLGKTDDLLTITKPFLITLEQYIDHLDSFILTPSNKFKYNEQLEYEKLHKLNNKISSKL